MTQGARPAGRETERDTRFRAQQKMYAIRAGRGWARMMEWRGKHCFPGSDILLPVQCVYIAPYPVRARPERILREGRAPETKMILPLACSLAGLYTRRIFCCPLPPMRRCVRLCVVCVCVESKANTRKSPFPRKVAERFSSC